MLGLIGCRGKYVPPTAPMPANTVLLAAIMQRLSAQPGFTEALLDRLNGGGKNKGGRNGPALMTPDLVHRLRKLILGKDWEGLDRFPGWTMGEITPTVHVAERFLPRPALKADKGGLSADATPNFSRQPSAAEVTRYLNVGSLRLEEASQVDLDRPAPVVEFQMAQLVEHLGEGVVSGDGPDPRLAAEHAASLQMAQLLNRMSVNGLDLEGPEGARRVTAMVGTRAVARPEEVMQALMETGHTVVVADARYFANFGHLHDDGKDVMMPFWVDTRLRVPGTRRALLLPVSHAEYEWQVRGPKVNADVAFYYGIDGHAEWRTMDELNQAWVLGRHAHEYTGAEALEVTRLASAVVVAYVHQHVARPQLPFGGYYTLGVCQDVVSAIEKKLTGKVTLFPNTVDARLFDDPRDAEVNGLMAAIPKDREGKAPGPERVFGSLPTADARAITIPGLADDIVPTEAAWKAGTLQRMPRHRHWRTVLGLEIAGVACAVGVMGWLVWWRRSSR